MNYCTKCQVDIVDDWQDCDCFPRPPTINTTQQDRTLADGKVKSATGYVTEPTTESIHDIPKDLAS